MEFSCTRSALEQFLAQFGPAAGGFTGAPVPQLLDCDLKGPSLRLAYEVPAWMVNPWGVVHGGLTTALIDSTFGLLAGWANGGVICPTVSLTTNYLRSVKAGQLIIEARVERFGRVAAHLSAKCFQNGQLTTTASGVFSTDSPREAVWNHT